MRQKINFRKSHRSAAALLRVPKNREMYSWPPFQLTVIDSVTVFSDYWFIFAKYAPRATKKSDRRKAPSLKFQKKNEIRKFARAWTLFRIIRKRIETDVTSFLNLAMAVNLCAFIGQSRRRELKNQVWSFPFLPSFLRPRFRSPLHFTFPLCRKQT